MCLVAYPLARQWLQDCWPCAGEPPFAGLCANVPAKDGPVQKRYLPIIVLVLAAAVLALVGYNLPDNALFRNGQLIGHSLSQQELSSRLQPYLSH